MNPIGTARETVAAALAGVGATVHTYPPGAISGPCVVLVNGSPALTARGHVTLEAHITGTLGGDHPATIAALEQLAYDTQQALAGANLGWADLDGPTVDTTSQAITYRLPITLRPC